MKKLYSELNQKNAKAFLKDYLSEKEQALVDLKEMLIKKGLKEDEFDYSPESLIRIWELSEPLIKLESPKPNYDSTLNILPFWINLEKMYMYDSNKNQGYSIPSVNIVNGLAYYYAEIFIKTYEASWVYSKEKITAYIYYSMPLLKFKGHFPNTSPLMDIIFIANKGARKEELNKPTLIITL